MKLDFSKYEGAGNDFILVDGRGKRLDPTPQLVAALCDRHFGIGGDGLMILGDAEAPAEFSMRYFNSDGYEATMCGNGGRCITLFAHHLGIGGDTKIFDSIDGVHDARIRMADADSGTVTLVMTDVDDVNIAEEYIFLNTGSPHYVEFVRDVSKVDVYRRGNKIRCSDYWVQRGGTNVNFVEVVAEGEINMRTYERGVEDETLACGTGATAAAIATHLHCQPDVNKFTVHAPGGDLRVVFDCDGSRFSNIKLKGPARRVFSGCIDTDNFSAGAAKD